MTRVHGRLFEDHRNGILAIQPSVPFFGCQRDEQHYDVIDGAIDIDLLPTPPGVFFNVGFKGLGDTRRTDFTLRWVVPNSGEVDVTPGAKAEKEVSSAVSSASIYERVQLKRVAQELGDSMQSNEDLEIELERAQVRIEQLELELLRYRNSTDAVLSDRDELIAQLQEQNEPIVKTVYLDKPVPPAALQDRIKRLEQENLRLLDLNAEYYKSVVQLHQLQLDKARNTPQEPSVDTSSSPQQRLLRKILGK